MGKWGGAAVSVGGRAGRRMQYGWSRRLRLDRCANVVSVMCFVRYIFGCLSKSWVSYTVTINMSEEVRLRAAPVQPAVLVVTKMSST